MDVFMYCAALLCEDCGDKAVENCVNRSVVDNGDSDTYPQGPYRDGGGEADTPNHCDYCEKFLENPLTENGKEYVRESYAEARDKVSLNGVPWQRAGSIKVTQIWASYYDYLDLPGQGKCCICLNEIMPLIGSTWIEGHNAEPIAAGRCCNVCNELEVAPQRIRKMV